VFSGLGRSAGGGGMALCVSVCPPPRLSLARSLCMYSSFGRRRNRSRQGNGGGDLLVLGNGILSIEISNETCNVGARVGTHGAFDLPPDTYRLPIKNLEYPRSRARHSLLQLPSSPPPPPKARIGCHDVRGAHAVAGLG
jgi:hypothetical protein